jgi:hypothetical protein
MPPSRPDAKVLDTTDAVFAEKFVAALKCHLQAVAGAAPAHGGQRHAQRDQRPSAAPSAPVALPPSGSCDLRARWSAAPRHPPCRRPPLQRLSALGSPPRTRRRPRPRAPVGQWLSTATPLLAVPSAAALSAPVGAQLGRALVDGHALNARRRVAHWRLRPPHPLARGPSPPSGRHPALSAQVSPWSSTALTLMGAPSAPAGRVATSHALPGGCASPLRPLVGSPSTPSGQRLPSWRKSARAPPPRWRQRLRPRRPSAAWPLATLSLTAARPLRLLAGGPSPPSRRWPPAQRPLARGPPPRSSTVVSSAPLSPGPSAAFLLTAAPSTPVGWWLFANLRSMAAPSARVGL